MSRQMHYPKVIGIRLDEADGAKLRRLCQYTNRTGSELVRTLIRLAQPVDVPAFTFVATDEYEPPRG